MTTIGMAPLPLAAAVVTANTAPAIGKTTYYNASGGNLTPPLLALSGLNVGARFAVRRDPAEPTPLANTVTFTCAGADTFYSSGTTTVTLPISGEQREYQVVQPGGIGTTKYWAPAGPINPVAGLDARYQTIGDVFNWKASNTRRLQRSMGAAVGGTGYADHLFVGDSETASALGAGVENYPAMWPRVMRVALSARGIPIGGTGWVMTGNTPTVAPDPRYVLSSGWLDSGVGYSYTTTNGSSMTFTADVPGTAISVAYNDTSSTFTVSVDGATPVTVTPGGTNAIHFYTVTGLVDTTHTVAITATSAFVVPIAVNVYRASGLRVHDAAEFGSQATQWATNTYGNRVWNVAQTVLNPDVVHISLGVNDLNAGGRTVSQVIADLTTIRNVWPNADAILYGQYQPSGVATSTWAQYIQALYALAATLNCPLVDLYQRSGGYTNANTNGMMGDTTHPNAAGQADWGLLVTNLLLRAS